MWENMGPFMVIGDHPEPNGVMLSVLGLGPGDRYEAAIVTLYWVTTNADFIAGWKRMDEGEPI